MRPIYPILKPLDWPHAEKVACCSLSDEFTFPPLIAFGFDTPERFEFLPVSDDLDYDELYEQAIHNLVQHECQWERFEIEGLEFVTCSGRTFSAEKLLDVEFMQRAGELLSCGNVLAAAPQRTCLFATKQDLDEPDEERNRRYDMFNQMILHTFEDDSYGHAPISKAIYLLDDGEVYEAVEAGWED